MDLVTMKTLAWGLGGLLLCWSGSDQVPAEKAEFAAPVRIAAGEKTLGEGRLYPSPAMHDVDGDGRLDVVVGDLFGKVTYASFVAGEGAPRLGAEQPLKTRKAEQIKFHNW